jgi:hypothetical protein
MQVSGLAGSFCFNFKKGICLKTKKKKVDGLLRDPAVELNVGGIQLARLGNLIAAKYNKAEAVEYFLGEQTGCEVAVFVDDNFDNVFSVFSRLAQRELAGASLQVKEINILFEKEKSSHCEHVVHTKEEMIHVFAETMTKLILSNVLFCKKEKCVCF